MLLTLLTIFALIALSAFLLTYFFIKVKNLSEMSKLLDAKPAATMYVSEDKVAQVSADNSFKELMVRLRANNEC